MEGAASLKLADRTSDVWEEGATTTICCLPTQDGEVCTPHVAEAWIFILNIKQHSGGHEMESPHG